MSDLKIPYELTDAIIKGECVLFIASGLSSQVERSNGKRLPNWSNFLIELLEWNIDKGAPFNSNPSEIKEMIDKGNHLMAAEELQEIVNSNDLSEFLNHVFRDPKVKPSNAHKLLTEIPFRAILTTNYDTLIEGAYTISNEGQMPKTITISDLNTALPALRKKNFFIFKMHGDIDRNENFILGSRSYNNLIFRSPEYLSFLETLFTTQTVLFMGFGGSDPDLDYLLNRLSTIFSRTLSKHFLLMPNTKFNFTERRRLLLDNRLEVIEYDPQNNHHQINDFLQLLSKTIKVKSSNKQIDTEQKERTNVLIIENKLKNIAGNKLIKFLESQPDFQVSLLRSYSSFFDSEDRILVDEDEDEDEPFPKIALIVLTSESLKSVSFEQEVEQMVLRELDEKLTLIPIIMGNIDIPYYLRKYQTIRIGNEYKAEDLEYIKAALLRAEKLNHYK
jgi:hypothetical protein